MTRPSESYGRAGWIGHIVVRNVKWARAVGISPLIEEHELHPVQRAGRSLRNARWRRDNGTQPGQAAAVFVVGTPRSGTNMIVRGLAASPEFEVRNEGDRALFSRYRLRSDEVVRGVITGSRHPFIVIKPLLDSHRIVSLLDGLELPAGSKALWMYRDVDGRARSALKKFGPAANNALRDIAAGVGSGLWQAQEMSPETLELVRAVDWARADPAEGAAMMWYVRNQLFFDLGLDRRPDVLPVSYLALVRDRQTRMEAICRFLGARWYPAMIRDFDERAFVAPRQLPIDPALRARCDDLAERLEEAATTASSRYAATSP
jgi:hypothetical protein